MLHYILRYCVKRIKKRGEDSVKISCMPGNFWFHVCTTSLIPTQPSMSRCDLKKGEWQDYLEVSQWAALLTSPTASPHQHMVAVQQVKELAPPLQATVSSTHEEGTALQQTASPEGTGYSGCFGKGISTWTLNERRFWQRNRLWWCSAGLPQTSPNHAHFKRSY